MLLNDPGISSITAALFLNVSLFSSSFVIFILLRRFRSRQIKEHHNLYKPKNAIFSESETPFFELLLKVYTVDLNQIYELCGLEAYMYIALHKQIIVTLSIMCFYGLIVLVPIYLKGHSTAPNVLEQMGISHILNDDTAMMTVIVFYVFYSCLGYILVYSVMKKFESPLKTLHNYAVEIKGLPLHLSPEKATKLLEEKLFPDFKEEIAMIYVVSDYTDSYKDYLRIQKSMHKLQICKDLMKQEGHRVQLRKKYFTMKVDAIDYYIDKIQVFNEDYNENLIKGIQRNTGFAYIICYSPSYAVRLTKMIPRNYDLLNSFWWSIKPAPSPREIKWENMVSNYLILRGRKMCLMLGFMVFFFLVLTPTAFSNIIDRLLVDIMSGSLVESFFSQYIPTIILLVYQSVILKHSISYLVSKEKHTNSSSETLSSLIKYLLFMGFYTFLYQLIGIQTLSMLTKIFKGDLRYWREELANSLMFSGSLYTIYIIQQTFISMGIDLMQIRKFVVSRFRYLCATTDKEKQRAYEAEAFSFGFEFSSALTSFMIIMCFSISFPIIVLFGLFYFCVRVRNIQLSVHKYLILCVNSCNQSSTGVKLPKICLKSLLTSIFVFQFITSSIILLNASALHIRIAGILWTSSLVIYIVLFFKTYSVIRTAENVIPKKTDKDFLTSLTENIYMHPIERMETQLKYK